MNGGPGLVCAAGFAQNCAIKARARGGFTATRDIEGAELAEPELLRNRVEWFIEKCARPDDLRALLRECVEDGGLDALVCVRRLYEDMYGGMTFNYELKAPAASTLLIWKELGLKALMEGVEKNPASKNISITLQLLATVAARENLPIFGVVGETVIDKAIQDAITGTPVLARVARSHLVAFILSFPDDDEVAASVGSSLTSLSIERAASARELFAAVSKRWLALSTPVLNAFDELIGSKPGDEHVFQVFLTRYPQILDPLAVRIWPQPDLFGFKEPDFVVQRADGSYMVVEIECPGKGLVTAGGQLTSEVTHAEQQAADYRRYLIRRFSEVEKHFPQLQEPDCLVVVGLERDLSDKQRQALRDANHGRNHLRIVGFDWLLERARTIAANMTQPNVEVLSLRVT